MPRIRDLLNELKWKQGYTLENVEITYVHRGAPKNRKIISGTDITEIGKSFLYTNTATIPYHRISKISYNNEIVYERHEKEISL